jgi:hypothetical protein
MPERSSLSQGVQVGVETVIGTNVAADKKLAAISIEPAVNVDMQTFRPMGAKYATVITPGKELCEADISGSGTYTELLYLFSSCLVAPGAPTTVDTSGKQWDFGPSAIAEDTVKSLTVEQGSPVRAQKFNYGLVSEVEIDFSRDAVEISGSMIGQRLSDGITMTVGPTGITQLPMLPTDIDVYMDTTSAGLGTTKLVRVLNANWHLSDRFGPIWTLNSALQSFAAHVETEPTAEVTLLQEADAEGMGALAQMRGGTTKFCRIKGTSPTLAGNTTAFYSMTLDQAVKVSDVGDFSDEDGVYALEWTFGMVYDVTWGKAFTAQLVNKIATL